jgi:hypothetical protein
MNRTSVAVGVVVGFGGLVLLLLSQQAPARLDGGELRAAEDVPEPEPPSSIPETPEPTLEAPVPTSAAAEDRAAPAAPTPVRAQPQPAPSRPPAEPPRASGPVAELKQRFETDPRDSVANDKEQHIRDVFRQNDIPAVLFESALCKQTVCRVRLRWAADRHAGYMMGLMGLVDSFDQKVAFDPEGDPNPNGELPIRNQWAWSLTAPWT